MPQLAERMPETAAAFDTMIALAVYIIGGAMILATIVTIFNPPKPDEDGSDES